MLKKILLSCLLGFSCCLVWAQRVISPVTGNFNNKQVLVLDTSDGSECFYSFSGTDPLTSGFAYDGPVLIDAVGRVNVRVAAVKDGHKEEIEVNFNVLESNPYAPESEEGAFISKVVNSGLYVFSSESPLSIPSGLEYAMGDGAAPYLSGKVLSLDDRNRLCRYLPCHISDGKNNWRFVIFVTGSEIGTLSKNSVPFMIENWSTFTFTGKNLIWNIDGGEWSASKIPLQLDRSVKHTVCWQSVAYEHGNPVYTYVIPPEPELKVFCRNGEYALFSIYGDLRYRMELKSSGASGQILDCSGLVTQAVFDTFEGDSVKGQAVFDFFCDGVFQGAKTASYNVDKKPPMAPVFTSSAETFYARDKVTVQISAEENDTIFVAVSEPFKITEEEAEGGVSKDDPLFDKVEAGNFSEYKAPLVLDSGSESAVFYKVRSYSKDDNGNFSAVSEYRVIIDAYNFYIDSEASGDVCDGSKKYPFNSFEQVTEVLNRGGFIHLFVKGSVVLPEKEILISSQCSLTGIGDARIIAGEKSSIFVKNTVFEAENILFEKSAATFDQNSSFFNVSSGSLHFKNCEITGVFGENGTLFNSVNSFVFFANTGLTVQAQTYCCALSSLDSRTEVKKCRVSAVAQTAVNFSVNGGKFECRNSSLRVSGHLGRIAELTATTSSMTENSYNGDFDKKIRGVVPVWCDKSTVILEDSKNVSAGF